MNKKIFFIICLSVIALIGIVPISAFGAAFELLDDPWIGFPDNTVIDFTFHNNRVWCITGSGVSFTGDNGLNWQFYDISNGLFSHDIASIHSNGSRLWLGMVSPENPDSGNYLAFTDDDGFTWEMLLIDSAYDYTNPIFDITGSDSLLFFTSMVSGLFGSFDGGETWRNIYYSIRDSILRDDLNQHTNHYFAAAVDTFHSDSIVVWGGTANGVMRYVYAPEYARLNSNNITNLASGAGFVFICGDSGLTTLDFVNSTENFSSTLVADGLPGMAVSSAFYINDRLFVGTLDSLDGEGSGLGISDDSGFTFHTTYTGLDDLTGSNKYPVDFISAGDVVFMAGYEGGLYKTIDTGNSWTAIALDADPTSGRNIVHSLDADSAYLWVGTDSGLVRLTLDLDNDAAIVDDTNIVFTDTPATGGRAYKVGVQKYYGDDDIYDSTAVWTILHPLDTAVGIYSVFYYSNSAAVWAPDNTKNGLQMFDFEFVDSMIYMVGHNNITISANRFTWLVITGSGISDSTDQSYANFSNMNINAIEIINDTIYLGAEHGLAISPAGSLSWKIFLSDLNPQHYSSVNRYTFADSLTGDFTNAMAIQATGQQLWASTHPGPAYTGANGITTISLDGKTVEKKYIGSRVWNFAFDNQNVFAASDAGLLFSSNDGALWDTLEIRGNVATYSNQEPFNLNYVPVYGVMVENNNLWIGTDQGAGKISLADLYLGLDNWEIYRDSVSGIFAYPVPFSPYGFEDGVADDDSRLLKFNYMLTEPGNVTIEVFDFAMNLVKTVTESEFRTAGSFSVSDSWDGRNEWGKIVAVGMYYFKISLSTGEIYWGKLAIMP